MPTLTAPIADSPAGKSLSNITSLFETSLQDGLKNGVPDPKEETVVEPLNEEAKPADDGQNKDLPPPDPKKDEKKPEPEGKGKPEPAKDGAKPEKDIPKPKEGQKLSELPAEQRDFVLLASQKRQLEAFTKVNSERDALKAQLEPLQAKVAELEGLTKDAPRELETLRAENERLKSENSEFEGKIKAKDVTASPEYKREVQTPWDRDVVGEIDDKGVAHGGLNLLAAQLGAAGHVTFDAQAAYEAISSGNEAKIDEILKTLPTDRAKARLSALFDKAQDLRIKHQDYTKNAKELDSQIKERQTQAEKQAAERANAEVKHIAGNLSKQVATRFPFLNGVEGDDNLNNALKKAQAEMEGFDVVNASPQQRAEAAHARAFAPIIAARQEIIIQDQQRQLAAKEEEHSKVEKELREQIASLEERLGNLNGETTEVQPGKRDASGRFAPKQTVVGEFGRLMAGKS